MLRRIFTLTTLFSLLLTSTAVPAGAGTPTLDDPPSKQGQDKAGQAADRDEAGRITKATVSSPSGKKIDYGIRYDAQNRVKAVVRQDGTQIGLVYDKAGQWQGFSFPDGGRMTFVRDAGGNITGFKREAKSVSRKTEGGARFINTAAIVQDDACRAAVRAAGLAAAAAAAACAEGAVLSCIAGVALAAELAYLAYKICTNGTEEYAY
jgi:YD repeat-containing protein